MQHYNFQKIILDNGFTINYVQTPLIQKAYAGLVVKYGSIHCDNEINGIRYTNNQGIAHFLEHKMFDKKDGDVFEKFVANDVTELNAYTSFDRTVYYIKFTKNFTKNLNLLLNFVLEPYFDEAKTTKEVGIINQEIEMYNDNLDWKIYLETISALYDSHPIINNILGTKESISKITAEELYLVHEHFYNLHNVELVFVGHQSIEKVKQLVMNNLNDKKTSKFEITNLIAPEPNEVAVKYKKVKAKIKTPKIAIGLKVVPAQTAFENLQLYWGLKLIMDCCFSQSSTIRKNLLAANQLKNDFSYYIDIAQMYGYIMLNGTIANNQLENIKQFLNEHKQLIIKQFKHYQKFELGKLIIELDKTQNIANELIDSVIGEYNPHLAIESLKQIDEAIIREIFDKLQNYAQTIVHIEE